MRPSERPPQASATPSDAGPGPIPVPPDVREQLDRNYDPYLQENFSVYSINPRRQEAYDKCAPDVVRLSLQLSPAGTKLCWT
jgi:hypothetical protein